MMRRVVLTLTLFTIFLCCLLQLHAQSDSLSELSSGKLVDEVEELYVMISPVKYAIDKKAVIGRLNKKAVTFSTKGIDSFIGFEGVLDIYAEEGFNTTFISAVTDRSMKDNSIGIFVPKIILLPIVERLSFDLTGKKSTGYSGKCEMTSRWKIFLISDRENEVAELKIVSKYDRKPNMNEYVVEPLMKEAARNIASIDTIDEFLFSLESEYIEKTRGKEVVINTGIIGDISQEEVARNSAFSIVTIEHESAMGSGIIVSPDGYIVTNHHVVKDAKEITVRTKDRIEYKALVVKSNPDFDLALLKVNGSGMRPLPFGDSDQAEVGDEVYAIGTPLSKSLSQSVSRGIISGMRIWNRNKIIQTDVSMNSGNSGGALINKGGKIIGVTTFKVTFTGFEGLGFCIPSNTVVEMLNLRFESSKL